jgi:spore maturation protein CgeB
MPPQPSARPTLLRLRRFGNATVRDGILAADPGLRDRSFAEIQTALDAGHGPFSSPLVPALQDLGWSAHDLILGVPAVREAWEREHGPVPAVPGVSDPDVLLALAEARRTQPDVVLDSNLNVLDRAGRRAMRGVAPNLRVLAGYMGTEKRFHRALALDLVLVPCASMADAVRPYTRGSVAVLPHSFDAKIVDDLPHREVRHPIVFAGALGPRYVERHRVLMAVLEQTELEAWIGLRKGVRRTDDGWLVTDASTARTADRRSISGRIVDAIPTGMLARLGDRSEPFGAAFNARMARRTGGLLAPDAPMRDPVALHPDRCHPPVSGRAYLELLRSAGTVLHRGIDALGGCGGALRLFEVTGVGAALLVEDSPTVRELFRVDEEVVTYRDANEAVERALWLTEHPEERERIARAGQRRTLQDHTASARARHLDPILCEALAVRAGKSIGRRGGHR